MGKLRSISLQCFFFFFCWCVSTKMIQCTLMLCVSITPAFNTSLVFKGYSRIEEKFREQHFWSMDLLFYIFKWYFQEKQVINHHIMWFIQLNHQPSVHFFWYILFGYTKLCAGTWGTYISKILQVPIVDSFKWILKSTQFKLTQLFSRHALFCFFLLISTFFLNIFSNASCK